MDIRKTRTCEKCKSVITLDKVRLMPKDKENNWLVCDNCCKTLKENSVKTKPEHRIITNQFQEKKILSCARCNYTFKIDTIKAGTIHRVFCPYCGRADKIENYNKNQKNDRTNATVTKTTSLFSKLYK